MEMAAESLTVIESEVMRLRAGATAEQASFEQQPQIAANFEQPVQPGASQAGDASSMTRARQPSMGSGRSTSSGGTR